jgi:hypothetical protein
MNNNFKSLIFLFLMVAMVSCKNDKLTPDVDFKYNFYPLALSKVWVYNVDSTVYSTFAAGSVKYQFQIKDTITNTFTDASNNLAYRVERYVKKLNETSWKYQKTISRTLKTRTVEELIDNKIYTRLVFPADLNAIWNANSKNNLLENEFSITETFNTYTQNNLQFGNTLIAHFEDTNLIEEDIKTYIYSQDVGLISAEVKAVDLDITNGKITNGFVSTMKLDSYK